MFGVVQQTNFWGAKFLEINIFTHFGIVTGTTTNYGSVNISPPQKNLKSLGALV